MWPTIGSSASQIIAIQKAAHFTYSHEISSPREYLLELTSEYGIPESLHPELPGPKDPIVEFPEGKVVIGAAKVSHFEINYRVLNIIPTLNLFRVFYTPSFNAGWMSFRKRPGKNTPQCYTKPLDSLKNSNNRFFWVDDRVFPTVADWRTSTPKDQMPPVGSYFAADVTSLNTRRTPIQKQLEALLCLVELSRRYFLGDDVYLTFLYDDDRDMDLFSSLSASNPAKVKTETRPRAAHDVPLLTATANRVIDMKDMIRNEAEANAPPKVPRKDYVAFHPSQSTLGGKSLASIGIGMGTTISAPATQKIPVHTEGASDPDPLSYAKPRPAPEQDFAQSFMKAVVMKDPDSEKSTPFTSMVGSSGSIYQPGWGVTNNCRLDTAAVCHDMVDLIVPPGYFSELRHLPNDEFLNLYNTTLARQVAMGFQPRLWFEQETKLLKKVVAQVARRDNKIEAREKHIRNVKALLEAKVDMKGAAEAKNVELANELESLRMDTRLDALSIDFDEELYPHMLTAITGRQWIIRHCLYLAIMKCAESTELRQVIADVVSSGIAKGMSEGLNHWVDHGKAKVDLAAIEAYDLEVDTKYVATLHALKDLKYPLVDQLEKGRPQWIHELRPISSQLKIPVYPEVGNPKDLWSFKDEILLEDAIAANVGRTEKKKKCRVVCRTHRVGSAHHTRSDGIPVSVPIVAP
nr:hypothetical protein [Tanacetum cinerariifolium]